jgi:molybdenum cofactor cytidylyltransferase
MIPRPLVAVLLAGGRGARFAAIAPGVNKLTAILPDGRAVIEASLAAYVDSVDEVIVVLRAGEKAPLLYLRRNSVRTIFTPHADLGMGHTLAVGAAEAKTRFPTLCGLVVGLADMPWLRAHTIARVANAVRAGGELAIARPVFEGQHGHPVGFGAGHISALMACTGDTGARALLAAQSDRVSALDCDDYGCVADVDRPADISRTLSAL